MKKYLSCLCIGTMVLLSLSPACVAKRAKLPPDPRFASIEQIVILPVVDNRAGKKDKVSLESLRKAAINNLKHKKYEVSASDSTGVGELLIDDLNDANPSWVKRLGPADSRWVMVVGLDDVHSKITFGSTGNAEVFGFLFDKQDGSVVWKSTGVGQAGQGGLMGMAFKGMMSGAALDNAMANLMSGIPKRPKSQG
jgi:hypothetical protein